VRSGPFQVVAWVLMPGNRPEHSAKREHDRVYQRQTSVYCVSPAQLEHSDYSDLTPTLRRRVVAEGTWSHLQDGLEISLEPPGTNERSIPRFDPGNRSGSYALKANAFH
jgi:hypothetical protein